MVETAINIVVCVKQVPDPEAPPSAFNVDTEKNQVVIAPGIPPVISPYDEDALETALRIKDIMAASIKVISLGKSLSLAVLRKCLAVGADELILLDDDTFGTLDSYSTAYVLSTAICKLGQYDIILTGRQASDTDAGVVGLGIAEILGMPSISLARKAEIANGKIKVERTLPDGWQVIEGPLPAVVTVGNILGELRTPTLKEHMEARKKPITTWHLGDLEVEPSKLKRPRILKMSPAPRREQKCQMVSGDTLDVAGLNLAITLREAKLL